MQLCAIQKRISCLSGHSTISRNPKVPALAQLICPRSVIAKPTSSKSVSNFSPLSDFEKCIPHISLLELFRRVQVLTYVVKNLCRTSYPFFPTFYIPPIPEKQIHKRNLMLFTACDPLTWAPRYRALFPAYVRTECSLVKLRNNL